jgi:hypothetical protein
VEISSHYPYRAQMLPETEDQPTASGESVRFTASADGAEVPSADSLTLVRTQNLASPLPEDVDLNRAVELLQQIQDQLQLLNKDQAGDLYQVDRLRDLLYRVSTAEIV